MGLRGLHLNFCILGQNPADSDALSALNAPSSQGTTFWFAPNIAIHETNMANFCQPGLTDSVPYCLNGANPALPIWGTPAGYGYLQLDPPPNTDTIWNWKSNIAAGINLYQTKAGPVQYSATDGSAYPFWLRQYQQWLDWYDGSAPASSQPCDQIEGPNRFTSSPTPIEGLPGSYWFGDAILMKQIGGAPTNYISWDNKTNPSNPDWNFNKANAVNANIVYEFSTCGARAGCQRGVANPPAQPQPAPNAPCRSGN